MWGSLLRSSHTACRTLHGGCDCHSMTLAWHVAGRHGYNQTTAHLLTMPTTAVMDASSVLRQSSAVKSLVPMSTTTALGCFWTGMSPFSSRHHRWPTWSPASQMNGVNPDQRSPLILALAPAIAEGNWKQCPDWPGV